MSIWYTHEGKKVKCDPRCISATGDICTCPCGGLFHRAAWQGMPTPDEWKDDKRAQMIEDMKEVAERLRKDAEGKAA